MISYVLHFCLCTPERLSGRAAKTWASESAAALRLLAQKVTVPGDCEAEVSPELLAFFLAARKAGARVNSPWLEERLIEDDRTPVEWFVLEPQSTGAFDCLVWDLQEPIRDRDDLPSIKADRMPPGLHVAGWAPLLYVSERFKAVVEAHRLTGVEFVWCRDLGKYQAPQWYLPVCQKGLGRGLDEPWIDASKLSGAGNQTLDPRGRHGQTGAFAEQYRRDAGADHPVLQKLIPMLKSMELLKRPMTCQSFPRFLRKHLPETDFAFTIQDTAAGGENSRHRGLALNRKARDVLRANRVVQEAECKPVQVLARSPAGVENLDRKYGPAEPAFTPEQWSRIRELEADAWAKHLASPKPPRAPDLARSLALLRSRQRRAPKHFAKPASPRVLAAAAQALGVALPAAWEKVLRLCNGGRIAACPLAAGEACVLLPAEELAKARRGESAYYREIGAELPESLLVVLRTELGDSVWLDTTQAKSVGDGRVVLMSHETGAAEREWTSVAEFLDELLTAED